VSSLKILIVRRILSHRQKNVGQPARNRLQRKLKKHLTTRPVRVVRVNLKRNTLQKKPNLLKPVSCPLRRRRVLNLTLTRIGERKWEARKG